MNKINTLLVVLLFFAFFAKGQNLDSSMQRAILFLHQQAPSNSYNIQFLFTLLARQYSFEKQLLFSIDTMQIKYGDDAVVYNFYNKLLGNNNKQNEDSLANYYSNSLDLDHLLLWGANPQLLPLDSTCQTFVQHHLTDSTNIRQLAHIALAFSWAKAQGSNKDLVFIRFHQTKLLHLLLKYIDKQLICSDNWMEGLVALVCLDKEELILDDWIKAIRDGQSLDGGWSWNARVNERAHHHTTILALWVLLATST